MRKQFKETVSNIFKKDKKSVLILGDIGVYSFKDLFKTHPNRTFNIGIIEQSMISFAGGLSNEGFNPIVHTITPFIVNRAFEQLKIDFGYNKLRGNFVSIGSSYDYAALGCTHHCPEDVNLMHNIPGMDIVVPGNSLEFDKLFKEGYKRNKPSYFRLTDFENDYKFNVKFGKGNLINKGSTLTILTFGPTLNFVMPIVRGFNLNLAYFTTVRPFDLQLIKKINSISKNILIIEPFYSGSVISEIMKVINKDIGVSGINIPIEFLTNYGSKFEHDNNLGFSIKYLTRKVKNILKNEKK